MPLESPIIGGAGASTATALYLYGVTWAEAARPQPRAGVHRESVDSVTYRELAGLTSSVESTKLPAKRRDLLRHAEVLGTALEHGTVLPLRFGVVFENATALVEDLLLPRYAELVQLLGRFEGRVELSVKAFFREEAILAEIIQANPRIARLREATRDASDGQSGPTTTEADMAAVESTAIHPLTGPVFVEGARPGDVLEVEFLDIVPEPHGFTAIIPGLGFLRDIFTTPYLVHWQIRDGWATSPKLPGVRIPGAPFMGVSGVAPSRQQVEAWTRREAELAQRGGFALPPDRVDAVPSSGTAATHGLRTLPPRENGGNFDVKHLSKGGKLLLPVSVEGALFSTGDAHFAQGDGEVCVTAVEMGSTCIVRFRVRRGEAERQNIRWPRFERSSYFIDPRYAAPERFIATMGMPVTPDGVNDGENLNLACRNAILNMMALLQDRGFSREQAYVICSVAVDLRISNVVDLPNVVVSALLPDAILSA